MTPEERARGIGYCTCRNASESMAGRHDVYCIFTQIAAAIRAAVEAEREACAQLMDEMWADSSPAEAIRARKEQA